MVEKRKIAWVYEKFDDLTLSELYELLRLRQEVFAVEQNCAYQDLDGVDRNCWHLMGWDADARISKQANGELSQTKLVAYLRVVPPGIKYAEASIGRVVTSPSARGLGLAREAMKLALGHIRDAGWKGVRISAQSYLVKFYSDFGFLAVGPEYLEDGIPHAEMVLKG